VKKMLAELFVLLALAAIGSTPMAAGPISEFCKLHPNSSICQWVLQPCSRADEHTLSFTGLLHEFRVVMSTIGCS
jgi:hypothetical protein